VTGAGGQLAQAFQCMLGDDGEGVFRPRSALDITDAEQVATAISETSCDWIVNAAAYTAVDAAESDERTAFRVNADGPRVLAEACVASGVRLAHVSTDFVFDGSTNRAYKPLDQVDAISVYGRSKLEGEKAIAEVLGGEGLIVRTSWLYGGEASNFVTTMLRLLDSRDEVSVVADQFGTPTWSMTLASRMLSLMQSDARGIHHVTDSGSATWYDFAVSIRDIAIDAGLIGKRAQIHPISTEEYPTPAARPRFSVLDKSPTDRFLGACAPHWRTSLDRFLRSRFDRIGDTSENGG
jgi:dTDP-4-dehydrorhamnose reductase